MDAYIDKDELYERVMGYIPMAQKWDVSVHCYVVVEDCVSIYGCNCKTIPHDVYCLYDRWMTGVLRVYYTSPYLFLMQSQVKRVRMFCPDLDVHIFRRGLVNELGYICGYGQILNKPY